MGVTVPFHKGQKLGNVSANALNKAFDAATRPNVNPTVHIDRPTPMPANNIIFGVNMTGKRLESGDVVKVSQPLSDYVHEELEFEFDLPNHESIEVDMYGGATGKGEWACAVAVVRTGGDRGCPVFASVYGRELVKIDIDDINQRYADIEDNSTALVSCEYGPFMLLGSPHTRGVTYWPVVFPFGGMLMPEEQTGGDDNPDEPIIGDHFFTYALGVVTGVGTDTNTVKIRRVNEYASDINRITLFPEEQEASIWPDRFSL